MTRFSEITEAVAEEFEVSVDDLRGQRRLEFVARARQAAYLICRLKEKSSVQIGHYFNRDHSTVLQGAKRAEELRAEDPEFSELLDRAIARLAPPMFQRRNAFSSKRASQC